MPTRVRALSAVCLVLAASSTVGLAPVASHAERRSPQTASIYPARTWDSCTRGEARAGAARDALTKALAATDASGVMIVGGGCVRYTFGNVREASYIASARKSVVAMLYGKAVARGEVSLSSTLEALGIDDSGGLLPQERRATVADLLAARSGVYHPAANLGDASERAPARGSQQPGAYFLYNNWDFNALEAILERATGRTIYELITRDFAEPMQFEDWDARPGAYAQAVRNDTGASTLPAHHIVLSTRDMARLGYLMLRHGRWSDRSILAPEWVARISSTRTSADEVSRTSPFVAGLGYGNLWWTLDAGPFRGTPLQGAYSASGAYGQFITVMPALDAVVAFKTTPTPARNVPAHVYFTRILPAVVSLLAAN